MPHNLNSKTSPWVTAIILISTFFLLPGRPVWAQQYEWSDTGNTLCANESYMETDRWGNVYVVGSFAKIKDFDPGPAVVLDYTTGIADMFIQKLTPDGNLIWHVVTGGTSSSYDHINSVAIDSAGNVYTCGYFQGTTVDFDPGPGVCNLTSLAYGGFVQKHDSAGNLL